jgi:lactoylglutathione lyase
MKPFLGATGVGVSNLDRSVDFYTNILGLGLVQTQIFDVEAYKEALLSFPPKSKPSGSPILLMQYKGVAPPKNQQGKFVFYVEDVKPVLDRCKQYGSFVYKDLGDGEGIVQQIAMVHDPDGFVVEFIPFSLLRASWGDDKPKI